MPLLDDLSGHEFEDLMEDVFRNLGYRNVRQSKKTGDEGRDILMEEVVDGTTRAVVVECKHQERIGRPVVQKLHSAVATYEFDGPTRGIVVTTGRFTDPAREYAQDVTQGSGPSIELIDGDQLREIGEQIGLDMRNGRIEILCDETLRPFNPARGPEGAFYDATEDIANLPREAIPEPETSLRFKPVVEVAAETNAVFETSVGVVNRVHESDRFLVDGESEPPRMLDDDHVALVADNRSHTAAIDELDLSDRVSEHTVKRFTYHETDYKEWAVEQLQHAHTETVRYTGGNNVTYTKTCEPNQSDISVQAITPVYLPHLTQRIELQGRPYEYCYYRAGPSRRTTTDGLHTCVACETTGAGEYTYCDNCGRIVCPSHTTVERLEQDPVCTECSVTERFMLATKHFYDEENLAAFEEEYGAMPLHEKLQENVKGVVVAALLGLTVSTVGLLLLLFVVASFV